MVQRKTPEKVGRRFRRLEAVWVSSWIFALFWASVAWSSPVEVSTLFDSGKQELAAGKYEPAIKIFSKVIEMLAGDKKNRLTAFLARSQAFRGKGDIEKAWTDLNLVISDPEVDPETLASGMLLRGTLNMEQGKHGKALQDFTTAINSAQSNYSLKSISLANRGAALLYVGEREKAKMDLDKALGLDSKCGFAYAARGVYYLKEDELELAKRDGEKALTLSSDPETIKIARNILDELSVSSGPNKISVSMSHTGQIFVHVKFSRNGKPHRFMLDTGATYTLVDRRLLDQIGKETSIQKIGKSQVRLADGSLHTVTRYRLKTAYLYDFPLGEIEVQSFDKGVKGGMNLLGTRSLGKLVVAIDSSNRKVHISH
jgi:tetratricopeptide (TPR) repeat protein